MQVVHFEQEELELHSMSLRPTWWQQLSQNTGLTYFLHLGSQVQLWRLAIATQPVIDGLRDHSLLSALGLSETECTVYGEFDMAGNVHCRICESRGFVHLKSKMHEQGLVM